jgi:hypothetical protein
MGKLSTGIWNYTETAALIGTAGAAGGFAGKYVSNPNERDQYIGMGLGTTAGIGVALGARGLARAGQKFFSKESIGKGIANAAESA